MAPLVFNTEYFVLVFHLLNLDDYRLRGGIFAMCGVILVLLLLLIACAILLHKERNYRSSIANEIHN
ncbi:hypothetical protein evm_013804 [Chilo suppressalis]|nr:hypothetical protein evm_013804 [Chilo suppressalis]